MPYCTSHDDYYADISGCRQCQIDAEMLANSGLSSRSQADVAEKYNELLMEVQNKIPGETRHETARRLIKEAETASYSDGCAQGSAELIKG